MTNFVLLFGESCIEDFQQFTNRDVVSYEEVQDFIKMKFKDYLVNYLNTHSIQNQSHYLDEVFYKDYIYDGMYDQIPDIVETMMSNHM